MSTPDSPNPSDPTAAPPAAPAAKSVKVRVLVDCLYGRCDDVVTLAADVAKAAAEAGQVDTDKAAVAYAQSLKKAE